jgi:hypothetical protein
MLSRNITSQFLHQFTYPLQNFCVQLTLFCTEGLQRIFQLQLHQNVFNFEEIAKHIFKQNRPLDWFLHGVSMLAHGYATLQRLVDFASSRQKRLTKKRHSLNQPETVPTQPFLCGSRLYWQQLLSRA